ncbi:MAG: hypothetical protein M9903_09060 [Saprospiraceae bacterium]|nr:hypothetical protein [Saprospiraceae bacterium]MCO5283624.1 hypothetical protein [Saprospiraceae bacterium]
MKKLILVLCIIIGIGGMFLPWFSLPLVEGPSGIELGYSWLGLALMGINLIPVFLASFDKKSSGIWASLILVSGLLACGYGLLNYFSYKSDILDMGDGNFIAKAVSDTISLGAGYIMYMAAGLVIFLIGLLSKK